MLLTIAPALAQNRSPQQLLAAGEFAAAWAVGHASDQPAEVLTAAEAANLLAQYRASSDEERRVWLARAQQAARRALTLDPKSAEAYYQLAAAQAEAIRFVGVFAKISLASQIKENLDQALTLDPDHARAYMGLALWHLQLAKRGLGWLYGASLSEVKPLFERALALEPGNIEIRKNYGFALLQLGQAKPACRQLQAALALPAMTAPRRLQRQRAAELLAGCR